MFVPFRPRQVVVAFLSVVLAAPLTAATPRDELLRFVPDDIGFCVVVQNLRANGEALAASPFIKQFGQSAFGEKLARNKDINALLKAQEQLKEQLGSGWDELRNDILGDAVVFAYRPGKPGAEQGLMMIRARNAEALAKLIDNFNKGQMASGELKEVQKRRHKTIEYMARVEAKTNSTNYYYVRGPILVFSGQEEMLQRALDLELAAKADAEPSLTTWLRQLGADRALFAVYVNPRAFDADLAAKLTKADEAGKAFLESFLVYWKALDGLALSLTLDRDATLAIGVRGRSEGLPEPARRLFAELAKPGDLWRQIPEDALIAVGGRIDVAALATVLGDFMTANDRQRVHKDLGRFFANSMGSKDVVKDVLPFLGPDWAMWLAPPADPKHVFPEGVLAVRVRGDADLGPALLKQVDFWAGVAVAFSPKPLELKTGTFDRREVKYLESASLPPGIRPAFALKDGFLVLAGTPERIGRFTAPAPQATAGPAPLLRISFKAWRDYLRSRRPELEKVLAEKDKLTPAEANEHLDGVLTVLDFLDRLEVRHQAGKGHAVLSIVLQTAQPLRK